MWKDILLGSIGGFIAGIVAPFTQQLIQTIRSKKEVKNIPPRRPIGYNTNNHD